MRQDLSISRVTVEIEVFFIEKYRFRYMIESEVKGRIYYGYLQHVVSGGELSMLGDNRITIIAFVIIIAAAIVIGIKMLRSRLDNDREVAANYDLYQEDEDMDDFDEFETVVVILFSGSAAPMYWVADDWDFNGYGSIELDYSENGREVTISGSYIVEFLSSRNTLEDVIRRYNLDESQCKS